MTEELEELGEELGEELEFSAVGVEDLKSVDACITGAVTVTVTVWCLSVGLGIKSEVVWLLWRMSCRKSEAVLLIACLILEGSCVTDMASCFSVLRRPDSTV